MSPNQVRAAPWSNTQRDGGAGFPAGRFWRQEVLWGRTHGTRGQRLLGAVVQPSALAPFEEGARKRGFHGLRVLWQVTEQARVQRTPPPPPPPRGLPVRTKRP